MGDWVSLWLEREDEPRGSVFTEIRWPDGVPFDTCPVTTVQDDDYIVRYTPSRLVPHGNGWIVTKPDYEIRFTSGHAP